MGLGRMETRQALIGQKSNLVLPGLFKPRSSARGANGGD